MWGFLAGFVGTRPFVLNKPRSLTERAILFYG